MHSVGNTNCGGQRLTRPEEELLPANSDTEDFAGGLDKEELLRIMTVTLDTESESESEHDVVDQQSGNDEQEQENSEDEDGDASITRLRQMLQETDPGTLRSRQLSQLLQQAKDTQKRSQERRRRRLDGTRSSLIELGVPEQGEEIIQDPDAPLPPPLQQKLQDKRLARLANEKKSKAKTAFNNPWLATKERELANYMRECLNDGFGDAPQFQRPDRDNHEQDAHVSRETWLDDGRGPGGEEEAVHGAGPPH